MPEQRMAQPLQGTPAQLEPMNHVWKSRLGGLRHARPDSPNLGWHNSSFRGFADYMQTPEFEEIGRASCRERV